MWEEEREGREKGRGKRWERERRGRRRVRYGMADMDEERKGG